MGMCVHERETSICAVCAPALDRAYERSLRVSKQSYPFGKGTLTVTAFQVPDATWVHFDVTEQSGSGFRFPIRLDHLKEMVAKIEEDGFR